MGHEVSVICWAHSAVLYWTLFLLSPFWCCWALSWNPLGSAAYFLSRYFYLYYWGAFQSRHVSHYLKSPWPLLSWCTRVLYWDDINYFLNKSNSKQKWSPKLESQLVENTMPFLFPCCHHSVFLPVVNRALVAGRMVAGCSGGWAGCGTGGDEAASGSMAWGCSSPSGVAHGQPSPQLPACLYWNFNFFLSM